MQLRLPAGIRRRPVRVEGTRPRPSSVLSPIPGDLCKGLGGFEWWAGVSGHELMLMVSAILCIRSGPRLVDDEAEDFQRQGPTIVTNRARNAVRTDADFGVSVLVIVLSMITPRNQSIQGAV